MPKEPCPGCDGKGYWLFLWMVPVDHKKCGGTGLVPEQIPMRAVVDSTAHSAPATLMRQPRSGRSL